MLLHLSSASPNVVSSTIRCLGRKRHRLMPPVRCKVGGSRVETLLPPNASWKPGAPSPSPLKSADMIRLEPSSTASLYHFLISTVVPRPVAVISSQSSAGGPVNVAPFSYFMPVSHQPPLLAVSINRASKGRKKDTLINIEDTGEAVINVLSEWYVEAANHCSGEWTEDEMQLSGLTAVASERVKPPRIAEAAVQMECKVRSTQEFKDSKGRVVTTLVVVEAVLIHAHPQVCDEASLAAGRPTVRLDQLRPISRLGGDSYGYTTASFDIPRPDAKRKA